MKKTGDKHTDSVRLSAKQREAIVHLVGARSLEEGRKRARISKSTLFEWLRQPTFKEALEEARKEVIDEGLARLKSGVTQAIDSLLSLINDPVKWVRLRASEKILDTYLRLKEMEEFETRLQSIEKIVIERRLR